MHTDILTCKLRELHDDMQVKAGQHVYYILPSQQQVVIWFPMTNTRQQHDDLTQHCPNNSTSIVPGCKEGLCLQQSSPFLLPMHLLETRLANIHTHFCCKQKEEMSLRVCYLFTLLDDCTEEAVGSSNQGGVRVLHVQKHHRG